MDEWNLWNIFSTSLKKIFKKIKRRIHTTDKRF